MDILGIDIGGSGIKAAPVDTNTGKLLAYRQRIATPIPATPQAIAKTVAKLVSHFAWTGKLGCGFPAVVQNGVIKTASNIDKSWIATDARKLFSDVTQCHTHIINDADAAGLAEMSFGAGKASSGSVLLLTVGTGIGSAIFSDGVLFPNTEFGHILLNGKIAESYASDAVRKNLDLSWRRWARRFNEYLLEIEKLIRPDLIIIGGGVSKKLDKFNKYLRVETKVVAANLLNEAGMIGAALAARLSSETLPVVSKHE